MIFHIVLKFRKWQ